MADHVIEVEVRAKHRKKDADTIADAFSDRIAEGLSHAFKKTGLGGFAPIVSGGGKAPIGGAGGSGMIGAGVAAGLAAGGVVAALDFIADAVKDLPVVTAVMKLFKAIITILFIPIIPYLKPALKALAEFARGLSGIAKANAAVNQAIVNTAQKTLETNLKTTALALGIAWEALKNAGQFIWDNFIKPGFDLLAGVGTWIWEQIVKPAFNLISGVGTWIWEQIIKPGFDSLINIGSMIWEVIKGMFTGTIDAITVVWKFISDMFTGTIDAIESVWKFMSGLFSGVIDVATTLWNWFTGLFKGTIDVASTLWNWFTGLFSGGGARTVEDAIITPRGVVNTSPSDYIIATKNPASLGGMNVTINIDRPTVSSQQDIKALTRAIELELYKTQRRYNSYV